MANWWSDAKSVCAGIILAVCIVGMPGTAAEGGQVDSGPPADDPPKPATKMPLKVVSIHLDQTKAVGVFQHEIEIPKDQTNSSYEFVFSNDRIITDDLQLARDALLKSFVVEAGQGDARRPLENVRITIRPAPDSRTTIVVALPDAASGNSVVVRYEHPVAPWSVEYRLFLGAANGSRAECGLEFWARVTNDTLLQWNDVELRLVQHARQPGGPGAGTFVLPKAQIPTSQEPTRNSSDVTQFFRLDRKTIGVESFERRIVADRDPKKTPAFPTISLKFSKSPPWPDDFRLKGDITVFRQSSAAGQPPRQNHLGKLGAGSEFPPKADKAYALDKLDDSLVVTHLPVAPAKPYKLHSINNGEVIFSLRQRITYTLESLAEPREVLVKHPKRAGWTIIATTSPTDNAESLSLTAARPLIVEEEADEPAAARLRLVSPDEIKSYLQRLESYEEAAKRSSLAMENEVARLVRGATGLEKSINKLNAGKQLLLAKITTLKEEQAALRYRGLSASFAEQSLLHDVTIRDWRSGIDANNAEALRLVQQHNAVVAGLNVTARGARAAFIQLDADGNARWSEGRWGHELKWMVEAGIDRIILAGTEQRDRDPARPPHRYFPATPGTSDVLRRIFEAVHAQQGSDLEPKLKVYLGLIRDEAWPEFGTDYSSPPTPESLNEIECAFDSLYQDSRQLATELWQTYSDDPLFAGFYIPEEVDNEFCAYEAHRKILVASFLKPLVSHLKALKALDDKTAEVIMSPYFNAKAMPPDEFETWWSKTVDEAPGIDAILLQDGVGTTRHTTMADVVKYLAALRGALLDKKCRLWSTVEVFHELPHDKFEPALMSRIADQLAAETRYADQMSFWEFSHYLSPPESLQALILHEDYLAHLNGEKNPRRNLAPGRPCQFSHAPAAEYPDSPTGKLTDGRTANDFSGSVGWHNQPTVTVTLDLERQAVDIVRIAVYGVTETSSAVLPPRSIRVAVSNDGRSFSESIEMRQAAAEENQLFLYEWSAGKPMRGRYFRFIIESGNGWLMLNEIAIVARQHGP